MGGHYPKMDSGSVPGVNDEKLPRPVQADFKKNVSWLLDAALQVRTLISAEICVIIHA